MWAFVLISLYAEKRHAEEMYRMAIEATSQRDAVIKERDEVMRQARKGESKAPPLGFNGAIRITWDGDVFWFEPIPEPFEGWKELAWREFYRLKQALFGKVLDVYKVGGDERTMFVAFTGERVKK